MNNVIVALLNIIGMILRKNKVIGIEIEALVKIIMLCVIGEV